MEEHFAVLCSTGLILVSPCMSSSMVLDGEGRCVAFSAQSHPPFPPVAVFRCSGLDAALAFRQELFERAKDVLGGDAAKAVWQNAVLVAVGAPPPKIAVPSPNGGLHLAR